jgi:hypothetical protein
MGEWIGVGVGWENRGEDINMTGDLVVTFWR